MLTDSAPQPETKSFPERLYKAGITSLISVIPPGARLSPASKIPPSQCGKVPGRRLDRGEWVGFRDWFNHEATIDEVCQWVRDGANIGIVGGEYFGVDIDCLDPNIAQEIETLMTEMLGAAPIRVGRYPKRLAMYRATAPFGRMRVHLSSNSGKHLVEILGAGQQWVAHGIHPGTLKPYEWVTDPTTVEIPTVTSERMAAFWERLVTCLEAHGTVRLEGNGRAGGRSSAVNQVSLRAPSIEALQEAVALIPNDDNVFNSRTDYLRMGYAIKAAAGDDNDTEGFEIFAEWTSRWDGGTNDPDITLADWRRMNGAKSVGWNWIAEQARGFGYNDAANDFEVLENCVIEPKSVAPQFSDQGLAASVIDQNGDIIRFVPETGRWLVWDEMRWREDTNLRAEDIIKRALRDIASPLMTQGVKPLVRANNNRLAKGICAASKLKAVSQLIRSDRAIAVAVDSLDSDPWLLNTTAGIVDLKTGAITPPRADALMTKSTAVEPDFVAERPEWKRFLAETTGGDAALEAYLQRLAGYALTGSTREQHLSFLFGPGGNGKSVFLNVLAGIMGDYACTATMDAFTASNGDRHSTEIAMFLGKRLVIASETQADRSWNEARVKSLTGGEPITARFMRQDNFTFRPSFKLIFAGNHKPAIRDVDPAMKRRIQMVPFTRTPARIDLDLADKLHAEWPAILAWMIAGSLAWQREGLNPPAAVKEMTDEYINEQDSVTAWLDECCEEIPGEFATIQDLFASFRMRCSTLGEQPGTVRQLGQALANRGFERGKHSRSRRNGFKGLRVRPFDMAEGLELVA